MSKIFDPDNAVFTFINKAIDTLWLGFLWSIIGLGPFLGGFLSQNMVLLILGMIISVALLGPVSCALYYATVKVTRRSRSYATKEFFRSFKQNIKVGSITSLIFGAFAYLMYIDFQYADSLMDAGDSMGNVMFVVFLAGSFFAVLLLIWIFPILSRFTVNVGGLFKNTMLIATRHIVRSLIMLLLWAVCGVLIYVFIEYILYVIFLAPLIPALICLVRSFVIEPVLKKYTGESEGDPEETGVDEWYRE